MKRKEKITLFFLSALILGAVIYSANCLLFNSLLTWQIQQKPYLLMLGELALVFILLLGIGFFFAQKYKPLPLWLYYPFFYGFTKFSFR